MNKILRARLHFASFFFICFASTSAFAQKAMPLNSPALSIAGSYSDYWDRWPRMQWFGTSVAVSYDAATGKYTAVVGSDSFPGAVNPVYVYSKTVGADWQLDSTVAGDDQTAMDGCGFAMAIDKNTLAYGCASADGGKVYIFAKDAATGAWVQQKEITGRFGVFGPSVSISGNTVAIGEQLVSDGEVWIYDRSGADWTLSQELTPPPYKKTASSFFGNAVQVSADWVVVGAPGESESEDGEGAAYVYSRAGGYTLSAVLHANMPEAGDSLGTTAALNGTTIAVGAPNHAGGTGEVEIFEYDAVAGNWVFTDSLSSSDGSLVSFGNSISLDNDELAIGEPGANSSVSPYTDGAIYTYARVRDTSGASKWQLRDVLYSGFQAGIGTFTALSNNVVLSTGGANAVANFEFQSGSWHNLEPIAVRDDEGQKFGASVSIAGDLAVVASPDGSGNESETTLIFKKDSAGNWTYFGYAPPPAFGIDAYGFHACTSVLTDGQRVFIGVPSENSGDGAVYVYAQNVLGTWVQEAKLVAPDSDTNFGCSLSYSTGRLLVGAPNANHAQGAAYTFSDSGSSWTAAKKLVATDGEPGDIFGTSVSLNGSIALVGAPGANSSTGSAYVFTPGFGSWDQAAKLTDSASAAGDEFGATVSLADSGAFVGAPNKSSDAGSGAGAVYIFQPSGSDWIEQQSFVGTAAGANLGSSLAASSGRVVAGESGSDSVQIYDNATGVWKLYASATGDAGSAFGSAVSISGTTIIVGAPHEGVNQGGQANILVDADVIFTGGFE